MALSPGWRDEEIKHPLVCRKTFLRQARLLNAFDFRSVFKKGKRRKSSYFTVVFCLNRQGQHARIGVVIPKRYNPHAVTRNRIRRVIRESFRHHQTQLGQLDLVIQVVKPLNNVVNTNLYEDLSAQWQQLKTL